MLIEDYFLGDWRDKVSDVSYEKFVEAMATYDDSSSTFDASTPLVVIQRLLHRHQSQRLLHRHQSR